MRISDWSSERVLFRSGCHSEHASCFMELCRRHSACPEIIDQDLFYLKAGHRHDHQPTTRSPAHARNTPVFQQPDRLDQRTPSKTIATDQSRPISKYLADRPTIEENVPSDLTDRKR